MDESKFNLWRACFSFCFVDGFLALKEQDWIQSKLATLPLSDEQRKILMADLKNSPDIDKLLPLITRPADRGFLINHIRLLSTLDNEVSENEKTKIDNVLKVVMSKVDTTELNNIIAQDEKASYHKDEVYKVHNKHSYAERLVKGLMKMGARS